MPDFDLATLEKLNIALEIMGFSVVGFLLSRINPLLKSQPVEKGLEVFGETVKTGLTIAQKADIARAVVTEYVEDGLDQQELLAALRRIDKVVKKAKAETVE